jgi:hypothetical protein
MMQRVPVSCLFCRGSGRRRAGQPGVFELWSREAPSGGDGGEGAVMMSGLLLNGSCDVGRGGQGLCKGETCCDCVRAPPPATARNRAAIERL